MPIAPARLYVWIACLLIVSVAWSARGEVASYKAALDQVPEGAEVVMVVPSLEAYNASYLEIREAAGLADMEVFPRDLVQLGMGQMGVEGVDRDGALIAVLPRVEEMPQLNGPDVLYIVPVSDYNRFAATLDRMMSYGGTGFEGRPLREVPEADAEGVSQLGVDGPRNFYIKQADGHAVLSVRRDAVAAYAPAGDAERWLELVGPSGRRTLDASAVAVLADVAALAPAAAPLLEQGRTSITANLDQTIQQYRMRAMDTTQLEQTRSLLNAYFDIGGSILRSTDAMVLGVSLSEAGATWNLATQVKPDTPLGQALAGRKSLDLARLYGGVPDEPAAFFFTLDAEAVDLKPLFGEMMKIIPKTPGQAGEGIEAMQRRNIELTLQSRGSTLVLYPPPTRGGDADAEANAPLMRLLMVYQTAKPAALRKDLPRMFEAVGAFDIPLIPGQAAPMARAMVNYLPNVEEVAGRRVDRMTYRMEVSDQAGIEALTPQQREVVQLQRSMFEEMAFDGYIASGEERVWQLSFRDPALLERAMARDEPTVPAFAAARVEALREGVLPRGMIAESYVFIPQSMAVVGAFVKRFGDGYAEVRGGGGGGDWTRAVEAAGEPGENAVIAMGIGGEGSGLVMTLHASSEAVGYFVKLGMAAGGEENDLNGPVMELREPRGELREAMPDPEVREAVAQPDEAAGRVQRREVLVRQLNRLTAEERELIAGQGLGENHPRVVQVRALQSRIRSHLAAQDEKTGDNGSDQDLRRFQIEQRLQAERRRVLEADEAAAVADERSQP